MNRQQKKCLIGTVGFHLLLILILVVGPGFFSRQPTPDNSQILEVIPATAVEATLNSGVKSAQPPPPAPVQPILPPPPPIVTPPPPQPAPPQPAPEPVTPAPTFVKAVEKFFDPTPVTPAPDDAPKPETHPPKPEHKKHEVKPDLSTIKRKDVPTTRPRKNLDDEREAREAQQRADAIASAVRNLEHNFTSSTKVDMPGTSSVSYASYASIIKSIYTRAWTPPENAANDLANVRVRITVSRDGSVLTAEILTPSGDGSVDESVQRTLDRVTFIAPFPEGSTEKQKTFIINFNLKAKRLLG